MEPRSASENLARRALRRARRHHHRMGQHRPASARVGPRQPPRARPPLLPEPGAGPRLDGGDRGLGLLSAPGPVRRRRPLPDLPGHSAHGPGRHAGLPRRRPRRDLRRGPRALGRAIWPPRGLLLRHCALRGVLAAELPARPAAGRDGGGDALRAAPDRRVSPGKVVRGARPRAGPRSADEAHVSGVRARAAPVRDRRRLPERRGPPPSPAGRACPPHHRRDGAAVVRAPAGRHASAGQPAFVQAGRGGRSGRALHLGVAALLPTNLPAPVRGAGRRPVRVRAVGAPARSGRA